MENAVISMNAIEVSFENIKRSKLDFIFKVTHALAIQNARIPMAVLHVCLAQLECNRINVELIVSISMNANIIFVMKMLHVRIPPVHITVDAMPVSLVMVIGAKILMNA